MDANGETRKAEASAPVDGRRERSRSSRRRIVEAMLQLVEQGDLAPSAARVAEVAGVGQRSVFRHFDDMDSLYREMSAVIERRVMPIVAAPYAGTDWRAHVRDLIGRRARVFEAMLPYRLAAAVKGSQSPFLREEHARVLMMERELLLRLLPGAVKADTVGVEALVAALSFQTWGSLRNDQRLSVAEATRVVAHSAGLIVDRLRD
ncbi:MAG: TetR family transcriptional regulator [Sphingomonadaceae bacterium]|nr:TetR family transcriptional regulator [Sphingomonadaceae bacterium]